MPEKSLVTGHMNPDPCSLTAIFTCVRLQIDRFEDGGWAVVLPYPDGRRGFDVPRELFPGEASVGDMFEVRVSEIRPEGVLGISQ